MRRACLAFTIEPAAILLSRLIRSGMQINDLTRCARAYASNRSKV